MEMVLTSTQYNTLYKCILGCCNLPSEKLVNRDATLNALAALALGGNGANCKKRNLAVSTVY